MGVLGGVGRRVRGGGRRGEEEVALEELVPGGGRGSGEGVGRGGEEAEETVGGRRAAGPAGRVHWAVVTRQARAGGGQDSGSGGGLKTANGPPRRAHLYCRGAVKITHTRS